MPGKFGKKRLFFFCSLLKLFQIRVNALQRPESPEEIGGGFRTDSRNAGDVIGRIADQPLEINQPSGRDAVSFPDRFLVVNLRFADAFLRRLHDDFSVYNKLKSVQIAGKNDYSQIRLFFEFFRQRPDEIVGFQSRRLKNGDAEFFHQLARFF